MGDHSVSGVDPEGLARLAVLLEQAANDLDRKHRRLTAAPGASVRLPALVPLRAVIDWAQRQAGDVRRRSVVAASDGRLWRRHGMFDHVVALSRAAADGLGDGLADLAGGTAGAVQLSWYTVTDPLKAARMASDTVRHMAAGDPMQLLPRYLHGVWVDGFWAASEDYVHASFQQVPSALLASAGGAARAAPRLASNASYLPALAPGAVGGITSGRVPQLLRLSVPVRSDGRTRVALDPRTGRFVVLTAAAGGVATRSVRWSGLDRAGRDALVGARIVDRKGRLRDDDD